MQPIPTRNGAPGDVNQAPMQETPPDPMASGITPERALANYQTLPPEAKQYMISKMDQRLGMILLHILGPGFAPLLAESVAAGPDQVAGAGQPPPMGQQPAGPQGAPQRPPMARPAPGGPPGGNPLENVRR